MRSFMSDLPAVPRYQELLEIIEEALQGGEPKLPDYTKLMQEKLEPCLTRQGINAFKTFLI